MFDQAKTGRYYDDNHHLMYDDVPVRYTNNGMTFGYCDNDWEYTNGQFLFSESVMHLQKSCNPNTGNAGNWYSWPASTAGGSSSTRGYNEPNSICPTGWQLTVNTETEVKSWYYLIRNAYSIQDNNDSKLLPQPMSFVRSGNYDQGLLNNRASFGLYWSSTARGSNGAYRLYFSSNGLNHQYDFDYKYIGFSVRCVSR